MLHMVVGCLYSRNLVDVLETDGPVPDVAWFAGAHFDSGRLFEEVSAWWRFRCEVESTVWPNIDFSRSGDSRGNVCGASVELFAEIHGLDTTRTERRTHWRRRCSLARSNNESLIRVVGVVSDWEHTDAPRTGL